MTKEETEAQAYLLRMLLASVADGFPISIGVQCLGEVAVSILFGAANSRADLLKSVESFCMGLVQMVAAVPDEVFDKDTAPPKCKVTLQ